VQHALLPGRRSGQLIKLPRGVAGPRPGSGGDMPSGRDIVVVAPPLAVSNRCARCSADCPPTCLPRFSWCCTSPDWRPQRALDPGPGLPAPGDVVIAAGHLPIGMGCPDIFLRHAKRCAMLDGVLFRLLTPVAVGGSPVAGLAAAS